MMRVSITPALRAAVFQAWGGICAYCETAPADRLDHIFPRAKGGEDRLDNFAACCNRCNQRKRDHMLADGYLRIIQALAASKAEKISAMLQTKPRVIRPPTAEPRLGSTFELNYPADLCRALLDADWRHDNDGKIRADGTARHFIGLAHIRHFPFMSATFRVAGSSRTYKHRVNWFISWTKVNERTDEASVEGSTILLPLLAHALEHSLGEFFVPNWPADPNGHDLADIAAQPFEVLKPMPLPSWQPMR